MKNNVVAQIIFRSAYLAVAAIAILINLGYFSIGSDNFLIVFWTFFMDYRNWAIIMSVVSMTIALIENISAASRGFTHEYTKKFPLLKFCTASSMLFTFLLIAFFVGRIGENFLVIPSDPAHMYGFIFPAIATVGYWTDISILLPSLVLPLAFLTSFVVFEERMKTRSIYATLGILPPTIYYFFIIIMSLIFTAGFGGADGLVSARVYGAVHPFFFFDSAHMYKDWWWILIWPTIFGLALMLLNNIVYFISRTGRGENGRLKLYRKLKVNEDEMCDVIHIIIVKRCKKKQQ